MAPRDPLRQALAALHQRPIAYYPCYARLMGSATGGILLSQLLYWWGACGGRKFDKSDSQLREETSLSEWEFRAAKKKLKQLDFLKATREGVPAKAYYDVDAARLMNALSLISSYDETSQLDMMYPQNKSGCILITGDDETSQLRARVQRSGSLDPETQDRDSPEKERAQNAHNVIPTAKTASGDRVLRARSLPMFSSEFLEFWKSLGPSHPRKVDKQGTWRVWQFIDGDRRWQRTIKVHLFAYQQTEDWQHCRKKPRVWLMDMHRDGNFDEAPAAPAQDWQAKLDAAHAALEET